jgi:hypothetical protein
MDALPLTQGAARGHLARFLFRGDDVFKEVAALSGGERSRLELALLFLLPANLLLLDEPTNHLDIPAREALESFMGTTDATLLVVSHDRRLLEKVCDSLWVVDDGLAVPFDGGYRAWRTAVADGWTVKAAAESEARRLHGGRSGARRTEAGGRGRGPGSQGRGAIGWGSGCFGRPGFLRCGFADPSLAGPAAHRPSSPRTPTGAARSSSTRSWPTSPSARRRSRRRSRIRRARQLP